MAIIQVVHDSVAISIYFIGKAIVRQLLPDSKQREREALKKRQEAVNQFLRRVKYEMKKAEIRQRLGTGRRMRRQEAATRLVVVES